MAVEAAASSSSHPAAPIAKAGLIAIAAYIGAQVIADITSVKVGSVYGRAVDMGTFVYPITFTLRDLIHKTLGRSAARTVIVTAAAVNLFMAFYLRFTVEVDAHESYPFGDEYALVLGPIWRIVIASILAEVVSELTNTEAYHWFVTRVTRRFQWARVAVSNGVAVPLDNVIFVVFAFGAIPFMGDHPLTLPWDAVWDIFWVNMAVKGLVTVASIPLIYLTPDRLGVGPDES